MYQPKVDIIKLKWKKERAPSKGTWSLPHWGSYSIWQTQDIGIGRQTCLAQTWCPRKAPSPLFVSTSDCSVVVCFLGIQVMWGMLAIMGSGKYKNSGCLFVPRCQFSSLSGTRSHTRRQLELFSSKHICQMGRSWFNFSCSHRTRTTSWSCCVQNSSNDLIQSHFGRYLQVL